MFVNGPNPTNVQPLPQHKRAGAPPPLVLIHDGGGTTFGYFMLGSLCREVWAIHNPKYFEAAPWEGGPDEMARHYVDLMVRAGIRGRVMLGGWSLGGLLSLAVARLLADDARSAISVAGLVLIDSPYHVARSQLSVATSKPRLQGLPDLVKKSFDNCDVMLQNWDLPRWDAPTCRGEQVQCRAAGMAFALQPGSVLYRPTDGAWRQLEVRSRERKGAVDDMAKPAVAPPPAVLIRCTRPADTADGTSNPCVVDLHREQTLLGWDASHTDFIKVVVDVDAHHYNMFDLYDEAKMVGLTARLGEALEVLDSLQPSAAG